MRPLLALVLLAPLAAGAEPTPRVPPGPATTFLDGPLDADGWVDYEAAVNARLGAGVTPATNFVAAFAAVVGPTPDRGRLPAEFYKALGVPEPGDGGPYLTDFREFLKATKPDELAGNPDGVSEEEERVRERPWAAKEFPRAARWLAAIDGPLDLAVVALGRPHFFLPLVGRRGPGGVGPLGFAHAAYLQQFRVLCGALSARAMARLGAGDAEGAWRDLLAGHRLARHVARGGTAAEQTLASPLQVIACQGTAAYLAAARPTAKRLGEQRAALDEFAFAPTPPAGTRPTGRLVALNDLNVANRQLWAKGGASRRAVEASVAGAEWLTLLKSVNEAFDANDAALALPDRAARAAELTRLAKAFGSAGYDDDLRQEVELALADRQDAAEGRRIATALAQGRLVRQSLPAAWQRTLQARERAWQQFEVTRVAFALAAYRADSGRYPATLGDLTPKYLATVPADLFNGKPLTYKPSGDGFLVSSVGVNGTDDGGRNFSDTSRGDDIRVRLPLSK